ncbi:penicillin acylase family protein [Winogradskyella sp. PC-19]|uniref:penicillin acylase family protein n=1 Tax=unclassified Winogradskyella TaxID=2615021 RepID=UPI000B3C4214|nr:MULTISPECIES: penicillin acylase family protein [unclassified Winogradskyella]ARV09622.1 penicillin acylase family protein [Winogradskyella sp. PC-19]RZN81467.1 MAG: penicillin acylase family protein [Winogradskyella sp.]
MKYVKLILSFTLAAGVFYALNTKFGSIPALGKFLAPNQGIWQNESEEIITGEILIPSLENEVTVHYDAQLIPHIFAKNDTDLYKAQGYITAKHRLWQMEFQTYAAAGRLSEILGESALEYDREQRRNGMLFGAENSLNIIKKDPEALALLEAYSSGVNAYINSLSAENYPVEYKLLSYAPEAWSTEKTMHLLMYMTDMLCGREYDLEFTNTLKKFGKERFDMLFPDFYDIIDPVVPKETDWSFIDTEITQIPDSELPKDSVSISKLMEKPHPNNGSNNWAISPKKSSSGNAILASDPHLGLNLPSIWFVMQLSTPEHNVYGATLPGTIGVIIGFNEDISWGVTNATRDVKDWYKIEFEDQNRQAYKYNNQWKKTELRLEEIKIKGAKTYIDSVVYTHHGPVSYDRTFRSDDELKGYAMKWAGHTGHNFTDLFYKLNRGKNYDDYRDAIKNHVAPAQNFIFASKTGDIGMWVQGQFANKWKGQGKFLLDGSKPEHDWQSYIPSKYNAHSKNPERGFLSSANQHPTDSMYPFYVYNDGYDTYRSRIINDFLRSKEEFDIQDFKDLQNSNFNLKASEIVPYLIENLDVSELNDAEKEAYDLMKAWDFDNHIESKAPGFFSSWNNALYNLVWDEFDVEDETLKWPFTYQYMYMLKNHPNDDFMDIQNTPEKETAKDLIKQSFITTVEKLNKWAEKNGDYDWANYKRTYVGHLLQALPAFSVQNIPIGGDGNTVNATTRNHGPSWRMVVEMGDTPKGYGIYPGGQSGNPGSKYYDNFIDDWAKGNYFKINFMQSKTDSTSTTSLQTLKPSN